MNVYDAMTDAVDAVAAAGGYRHSQVWQAVHEFALRNYLEAVELEALGSDAAAPAPGPHAFQLTGTDGARRATCSCGWAGPAMADPNAAHAGWRAHLSRVRRTG